MPSAPSVKVAPVELCLFAPYNEEVALIGDWNNWQRQPMKLGQDGWWRLAVDLPDGEHHYAFAVKSKSYFAMEQWVEVFDPYAIALTPTEPQRAILNVKDGKRQWINYQWQHDDVPLPTNDKLVIYELHVGDFSGGLGDEPGGTRKKHRFEDVVDKLDYLKTLGINCIELLPVKEFKGKQWGYMVKSLFAVESSYGSPEDLCRLIDECHGQGMRVIIDGVYNHADPEAPLAHINYGYWFYEKNPDPPEMDFGPKFNYENFDANLQIFPARKYVVDSIEFWVREFHIDGIRFDATAAIRNFDVLRELADAAEKMIGEVKPFITIAEHVPEDAAITGRPHRGPMHAAWHVSYSQQLQAIVTRAEHGGSHPDDLENLLKRTNPATNGFEHGWCTINYLVSHDDSQIMQQIGEHAKLFDDPAFERAAIGAVLLLTGPGIPMLWMGQEFGAAWKKTLESRPLDWTLHKYENNKRLYELHCKLIELRLKNPAFATDHFETLLVDHEKKVMAYKRWNDEGNVAVVVVNTSDAEAGDITIENAGLEDGAWRDELSGADFTCQDHKITVNLPARGIHLLFRTAT
jgi:1,4-alpha-glucan branching enzyme